MQILALCADYTKQFDESTGLVHRQVGERTSMLLKLRASDVLTATLAEDTALSDTPITSRPRLGQDDSTFKEHASSTFVTVCHPLAILETPYFIGIKQPSMIRTTACFLGRKASS